MEAAKQKKIELQAQKDVLISDYAVVTKTFQAIPSPSQAEKDAYALATTKFNDAMAALNKIVP